MFGIIGFDGFGIGIGFGITGIFGIIGSMLFYF
jgi:hypothetical protein